jgi:hypothetical protein
MIDKEQDPALQAPQGANTTKHINFLEAEDADMGNTGGDNGNDTNDDSPTKKAWEELRKDEEKRRDSNGS